jgi:large exoprotein involved in heme utilization and adhesion
VNPNGIEITRDGSVKAGGFVGSTLGLGDGAFIAGSNTFSGNGSSATVRNRGRIRTNGGEAVLIGGRVVNEGTIAARGGRIGLASGEEVSVDMEGDGFLTVSVRAASSTRPKR